jgi:hypothetical protein
MRLRGKIALCVITMATLLVSVCEPAEARRRFRFGVFPSFGGGSSSIVEKIDKVYDLPDNGTYFHEGKYYDIGNFYQVRDGAETHGVKPILVLYNGDRYLRLDESQLALITADLGFDPTAGFRAAYAAKYPPRALGPNEIARREGETSEQLRERVRAMANSKGGKSSDPTDAAATPSRSGLGGGSIMLFLMLSAAIVFGARKFMRGRIAGAIDEPEETGPDRSQTRSFDQRVAEQLRAVHGGPAPQPAMAGPRSFGRKTI